MRDLLKRISNHDSLYVLAVVQVLGEDYGGVLGIRSSNDQAVPKGQAVIILDLGCVQNDGAIVEHQLPGQEKQKGSSYLTAM
jgi:hypothetical protein